MSIDTDNVPTDYEALVKQYEEQFSVRYTKDDEYYVETLNKTNALPPCIYPWYNKPRRNFDYNRSNDRRRNSEGRGYNRYHPYNRPAWQNSQSRGRDRDSEGRREGSSHYRDRHSKRRDM